MPDMYVVDHGYYLLLGEAKAFVSVIYNNHYQVAHTVALVPNSTKRVLVQMSD